MKIEILTEKTLPTAVDFLAQKDPDLEKIKLRFGYPPLWGREPGFPTLVNIVLEQQVSLAAAKAAFNRLKKTISPLSPAHFLELDDKHLKKIGFSRQKTHYCRIIAKAILDNALNLAALETMENHEVRDHLKSFKGIGDWTADIYLLMALRRADVWPANDLALVTAVQRIKKIPGRPDRNQMVSLADEWKPYRAAAARLFWHYYLSAPTKKSPNFRSAG